MKISMHYILKKKAKVIFQILIIASFTFFQTPAQSFIPYVYEPKEEDLKKTSLSVGRTAAQLIHFGQIKEASRLAKLAVKLNPEDERLWSILAETQIRNNLLDDARNSIQKAKSLSPSNGSLFFAEASIVLQQKNPNKAVKIIQEGLKLDPENAGAYFQLGNIRIMQNKSRLALKSFKKATQIKPDFWEALNNQGLILFEIDKIQEAVKTWRKVLTIKENAEPMLALAVALNKIDTKNQESIKLAKSALAKNPNYVSSKHQAEQLWGNKLQEATQDLFKRAELLSDIKRAFANSD